MRTRLIVRALITRGLGGPATKEEALVNVTRKGPRLLGGRVKKGESLHEALRRELLEEVGCGSIIGDAVNVLERVKKVRELTIVFKASVIGEPIACERGIKLAWIPRAQVCGYNRTINYQAA